MTINQDTKADLNNQEKLSKPSIDEITEKLNELSNEYNIEKYFSYLRTLNFQDLPQDFSEQQLDKIDTIIAEYLKNIITTSGLKSYVKKGILLLIISLIGSFSTFFFSFSPLFYELINIITFLTNFLLVNNIYNLIKEYKFYRKEKNRINVEGTELKRIIIDAINLNNSISISKEIEKSKEKALELVNHIGEKELAERITDIERRILLLPNEEEKKFQERLQNALAKFKKDVNTKTPNVGGITLILKSRLDCLKELNHSLDEIESDLENRALFIKKEQFIEQLDIEVKSYLNNIGHEEYKTNRIMNLMILLGNILESSDDIVEQIEIQEQFALCFWETMKYIDYKEQGVVLNFLRPVFWDRIILFGEKTLDNLEQNLEVLGIRSELLNFKNSAYYNKRKYLEKLIYYVNALTEKYNSNDKSVLR